MGRWADFRFARKHHLDRDYGYGDLDQIVFVGASTFRGGPDHYFAKGWPASSASVVINPDSGTASGVVSTSLDPKVSIAYAWYTSSAKGGVGWLYAVWCRRGFEYFKAIEKVGGKGQANQEVVMTSIAGEHVVAARKLICVPHDKSGGALLGETMMNGACKLYPRDPKRFRQVVKDLESLETRVTGLMDIAATL